MIPVAPQPEPANFDQKVRQPGLLWFATQKIDLSKPLLPKTEVPPYWTECLDDLHDAYDGICAYVSIYIEPVTGARTTEHFVAKSPRPDLAYEWTNYRLACAKMNSRKGRFDGVFDPFTLAPQTFHLVLLTGEILPNALKSSADWTAADNTIRRLGLDDPDCRQLRQKWYLEFRQGHISADFLRRRAPFVWQEARRQGFL